MKKRVLALVVIATVALGMSACGKTTPVTSTSEGTVTESGDVSSDSKKQVADASDMTEVEDVVNENLTEITADKLNDGTYDIDVDSSSSMFNITECKLTVENGQMRAVMTMGGTGYLYVFMGTGEEAAGADEAAYIPFEEKDGIHSFTVPVEALDKGIAVAAFSKKKEMWYDRTLVFKSSKLDQSAFKEGVFVTADTLSLKDGVTYNVEVALTGGSGRASVTSPCEIEVKDGVAVAKIEWSSPNYDYMVVGEDKYLPVNEEGNSVFEIPVNRFDYPMDVAADTTAMSTPHEIEYTLTFKSDSITENK